MWRPSFAIEVAIPRGPCETSTVSRQFLTRNYPRPNCLLKCLQNCLSHTREGHFFPLSNYPRGEGNCETLAARRKLSRGYFFAPATSRCLFWPSGHCRMGNRPGRRKFRKMGKTIEKGPRLPLPRKHPIDPNLRLTL